MTETKGICCTLKKNDPLYSEIKFFMFEIDKPFNPDHYSRLVELYDTFQLDMCVHRSLNSWHFHSPTMVKRDAWKLLHKVVEDINDRCPQICLRTEPNKWKNEKDIWQLHKAYYNARDPESCNSKEYSNLLNKWFGTHFKGEISTELNIVKYKIDYDTK